MKSRYVLAALLAGALMSSCTVIDVRYGEGRGALHSDGLISGFVDAGWTADDSLLRLSILDDSLIGFNVWKLVRLELGLVGFSLGVGPFDAGFGVLFYDARPPRYGWTLGGDPIENEWVEHATHGHHDHDDDHDDHCDDHHDDHDHDDDHDDHDDDHDDD